MLFIKPCAAGLLAAFALLSAVPAGAAADTVVDCAGNRPLADTGIWHGDLSVRNMSCRRGRRLLSQASLTGSGGVRVPHYRCRVIGHYGDGGIFRCTRRHYALRFSAGG